MKMIKVLQHTQNAQVQFQHNLLSSKRNYSGINFGLGTKVNGKDEPDNGKLCYRYVTTFRDIG